MASKLTNAHLLKHAARGLASQAAAQKAAASSGSLQTDKAPNGATVISVDNNEPLSRIGVYLKAGARYSSVPGLSKVFQHCASGGLSGAQRTGVSMVRTAEQLGAKKDVAVGREVAAYTMSSYRDCVDEILSILSSLTSNADYKIHEYPIDSEIARLRASVSVSPLEKAKDMAVKAAYRSQALGNSIYAPEYSIEAINVHQVNDFIQATHGSRGLVVVGQGIDHELLYSASSALGLTDGGVAGSDTPAKYMGGDLRLETGSGSASVVVAAEGAKFASVESLNLMVAAEILSTSSTVSFGEGGSGVLSAALKGAPVSVSSLVEAWSDTGLVGFTVEGPAADTTKAVSTLVSAVKNLSVGEKEVAAAKAAVTARFLQNAYGWDTVNDIGTQMTLTGQYFDTADAIRGVEAVTPATVNKAIAKAFSGKLTVAAVGNVNAVPYADSF